jgi:hypothetical protein
LEYNVTARVFALDTVGAKRISESALFIAIQMSMTVEISVHSRGIQKCQLFEGRLSDQMLQVILQKIIHHVQRTWIIMNRVVLELKNKKYSQ